MMKLPEKKRQRLGIVLLAVMLLAMLAASKGAERLDTPDGDD